MVARGSSESNCCSMKWQISSEVGVLGRDSESAMSFVVLSSVSFSVFDIVSVVSGMSSVSISFESVSDVLSLSCMVDWMYEQKF